MRSGHNTNIRHRGTLFHVQTEDSGLANPYLTTHLFHEGSILASEKQSYAEAVDEDGLDDVVKSKMEAQHVAMLKRLRAGSLDDEIEARLGSDIFAEAAEAERGGAATERAQTPTTQAPQQAPRRRGAPAPSADASLDEMVLDYLAERGPRSPGAR